MENQERNEQEQVRRQKLAKLREQGFKFPNDVLVDTNTQALLALDVQIAESSQRFTLAGRIVQLRQMGKAAFFHILDGLGKIQCYIKKDIVQEASYEQFKDFDIGDIVEIYGYLFVTKTGEKSLFVEKIRLLTKGLVPLPEKWHGLSDVELRYRQRYLDLIANPEVRSIFVTRAKVIREIRSFLDSRGYLEVEVPVLQAVAGGANAKPFKTFYNSLDSEMFLRIALELPLKKLVVGGLERVYEIGRVFRNEGLSRKHNPEFTMIEFYQAYATYNDLMDLTQDLFLQVVKSVNSDKLKVQYAEHEIDFTPPWPRLSMQESIHVVGGIEKSQDLNSLQVLRSIAEKHSIKLDEPNDWGRVLEALWGHLVEPKLIQPTFITNHPFSISPLARRTESDQRVTDRFELIIAGMECANAFSELNDADDQRERFELQAARGANGDQECPDIEHDFLRALEYGMPPTAGEGIGIDRLVMLLTNSHTIRDVLLFPQLKVT